jgi:transcriptional regulator with XRE-family HTH domain
MRKKEGMHNKIGKIILLKLKESGMSKNEFARRINKSPQNVHNIFNRQSVDTKLLLDISKVLEFNFFALFLKDPDLRRIHEASLSKDKVLKLTIEIEKLKEINFLLKRNLKEVESILGVLTK